MGGEGGAFGFDGLDGGEDGTAARPVMLVQPHLGFRVLGSELTVHASQFHVSDVGMGCGVWGVGCRAKGAGCRVQGVGFRLQGVGCRV